MQFFLESAVIGLSLGGSFAVTVIVQKTALGLLLRAMGPHRVEARRNSSKRIDIERSALAYDRAGDAAFAVHPTR